jgi:dsRNA-specific ribonuclease
MQRLYNSRQKDQRSQRRRKIMREGFNNSVQRDRRSQPRRNVIRERFDSSKRKTRSEKHVDSKTSGEGFGAQNCGKKSLRPEFSRLDTAGQTERTTEAICTSTY